MSKRTVRQLWCIRLFATGRAATRCLEADMEGRFYYHEGHEEHEGNQSTNRVHAQSLFNALQLDKEWVLH